MSNGAQVIIARGEVGGTWWKNIGAIIAEANSVHTFIEQLNDSITRENSPADYDFRGAFIEFYKEWLRWRSTHKYKDILLRFDSGPSWDKLMEYKKRANQWQKKFNAIGGKTAYEALPEEKKEISLLKTALYGGLILGGIFVATKAYEQVKGKEG